jgi:hypothetical protein
MTATLTQAVDTITECLDARDLAGARHRFDTAVQGRPEVAGALVMQLAATVVIPPGMVVWGFGIDVWANPHRYGYAWRCGACPWTGNNYRTADGSRNAAGLHVTEHHLNHRIAVVEYCSDAYWRAADGDRGVQQ